MDAEWALEAYGEAEWTAGGVAEEDGEVEDTAAGSAGDKGVEKAEPDGNDDDDMEINSTSAYVRHGDAMASTGRGGRTTSLLHAKSIVRI